MLLSRAFIFLGFRQCTTIKLFKFKFIRCYQNLNQNSLNSCKILLLSLSITVTSESLWNRNLSGASLLGCQVPCGFHFQTLRCSNNWAVRCLIVKLSGAFLLGCQVPCCDHLWTVRCPYNWAVRCLFSGCQVSFAILSH